MSGIEFNPAQTAAIQTQGRDLLVTAGAGTGKTLVLVERVLYKLRSKEGWTLDDLLVVTFTDKAAQQMRERIYRQLAADPELRRHLPKLPRAAISTIHSFCGRLLREHFLEARLEPSFRVLDENGQTEALDEALRQTFHAWYARGEVPGGVLFQKLVEMAGFDEKGEVLRRVVRDLYAYARVTQRPDNYLEGLLSRPLATRLQDLPWYGAMVRQLCGDFEGGAWVPGVWERGVRLYGEAVNLAREGLGKAGKMEPLHALLVSISPSRLEDPDAQMRLVRSLVDGGYAEQAGGLRAEGLRIRFPGAPRGANQIPGFQPLHALAKEVLDSPSIRALPWDARMLLDEEENQRKHLDVLVRLVREMDGHYQLYKRRNGLMDFSDLEIHAVRLLREYGEPLGLPTRFREVLVDEFQDVNALQNEILSFLSPETGRFRVGDVKQSIYQFRLADPSIFLGLARGRPVVRGPGDVPPGQEPLLIPLAENHRSRPAVLRFANAVFSKLFDESAIGTPYEDQALRPGRGEAPREVPVELHLIEGGRGRRGGATEAAEDGNTPRPVPVPRTSVELQARWTALRIRRLVQEECAEVERTDGSFTPVHWGDVAVLLRSTTVAQEFLDALEAEGIPAVLTGGGDLLEEEAVRDFRCLLSVVDNPRDDVALAAVLRSPAFGVLDGDLLRLRMAWPEACSLLDAAAGAAYGQDPAEEGGAFWPPGANAEASSAAWTGREAPNAGELVPPALRARLRGILDRLAGWRHTHGQMELVRFLHHLLEEVRFIPALLAAGEYSRSRAALEKFLSLARAYESERGSSLHGFLARISALEATGGIDAVPHTAEELSAVHILSVHKAKGLEFPVVVLPRLEWRSPGDRLGDRIRIGRDWIGLRQLDFETWGQRDSTARRVLAETQDEDRRAEEARILYVAVTRAQERLILVGTRGRRPWETAQPFGRMSDGVLLAEQMRKGGNALEWILATIPWGGPEPGSDAVQADETAPGAESGSNGSDGHGGTETSGLPSVERRSVPSHSLVLEWHPAESIPWDAPARSDGAKEEPPSVWRDSLRTWTPVSLPASGRSAEASRELESLLARVGRASPYPPLAFLDDLKGKYWVTEFKAIADRDHARELEEEGAGRLVLSGTEAPAGTPPEGAARRGTLYHAAIARLDLTAVSPVELDRQFAAFALEPWWEGAPRDAATESGIAAFFEQELGRRLSLAASVDSRAVEREVAFSCKWPVRSLARWLGPLTAALNADPRWRQPAWEGALDAAWVLVQGRIDCLFRDEAGWAVLDWKTDRLAPEAIPARASAYGPQMEIYRDAVSRLWGAPVRAWLAFVTSGSQVEISGGP